MQKLVDARWAQPHRRGDLPRRLAGRGLSLEARLVSTPRESTRTARGLPGPGRQTNSTVRVAFVPEQAGERWPRLELKALGQRVIITEIAAPQPRSWSSASSG